MNLIALMQVNVCLLRAPVWCIVALSAVNSVPLINLVDFASWPANDDPFVPAHFIIVMAGSLNSSWELCPTLCVGVTL